MGNVVERKIVFFKDEDGSEPVKRWLDDLCRKKRVEHARIVTRIKRAGMGNFGSHRFLAGNLGELKVDYGPGYRVYFGLDGDQLVILLNGGTKKNQEEDIQIASERWNKYQEEKSMEASYGQ
jgi:putative addiction module killer protein